MKMWVARDRDYKRQLFLYVDKPKSYEGLWYSRGDSYEIDNRLFPEVTFENSPQEVELVIKKKTCRGCLHYENHCPFIAEQDKRGELGLYPNRVCGDYKNREEQ